MAYFTFLPSRSRWYKLPLKYKVMSMSILSSCHPTPLWLLARAKNSKNYLQMEIYFFFNILKFCFKLGPKFSLSCRQKYSLSFFIFVKAVLGCFTRLTGEIPALIMKTCHLLCRWHYLFIYLSFTRILSHTHTLSLKICIFSFPSSFILQKC